MDTLAVCILATVAALFVGPMIFEAVADLAEHVRTARRYRAIRRELRRALRRDAR